MIDTFVPFQPLAHPEDTVFALKSNDGNAYEALFREYYSQLCRYAYSLLNDKDDAKDTVQKVFIEIWEKRSSLEIRVSVRSYLYRSVHNRCLNRIKANKRFNSNVEISSIQIFAPDVDEQVRHTELKKRIDSAIEKLPTECARIFRMSRFENLKYKEIADQLELSVKTVENQMGKALKILRTELSDYLNLLLVFLLIK